MASNTDTHLHRLWQEQARDARTTPLGEIQAKAEQLDTTTRRWNAVGALTIILMVIAEAWQVWVNEELLERTGDTLTIAALLYVAYRYRAHRRAPRPAALGSTTCVEFYRAELVRQRDLASDSRAFLMPFVPGVTLSLLAGNLEGFPTFRLIGVAAFGVAMFLGIAWWNAYTSRKRQREIDALDASERR
jgi:hypothetical protein